MARLIDANKQLEWVDCIKPIQGVYCGPVILIEKLRDIVIGAPTIDAIPVAWIEKFRIDAIERGDGLAKDMLDWLLNVWRKEQEANQ